MAGSDTQIVLNPGVGGAGMRVRSIPALGDQEVITLADKDGNFLTFETNQTGTWNYQSGSLTSAGSVTGSGKCIGIRVFATASDGSFDINGGSVVTVRQNFGVDINPLGNVVAPVVNWHSGTLDIVIEGLT